MFSISWKIGYKYSIPLVLRRPISVMRYCNHKSPFSSVLKDGHAYRHTTRRESTTREAHQDNLIARLIVRCGKIISLPNVLSPAVRSRLCVHHCIEFTYLRDPRAEDASSNCVCQISFRSNTRLVVQDLDLPVQVPPPQGAIEASHIRRNLKCGIFLLPGRPGVGVVAVLPGPVQTQNKAFSLVGHCVQPR